MIFDTRSIPPVYLTGGYWRDQEPLAVTGDAVMPPMYSSVVLDRKQLKTRPLKERQSKSKISDIIINPDKKVSYNGNHELLKLTAQHIINAKKSKKSIIIIFGAHLIKNGCQSILIEFIKNNYVTHLATNGAGSIHDWEFAYQGCSEEDVRKYIAEGQFGLWEETGKYLNLAIIQGSKNCMGYVESISHMIAEDVVMDTVGKPIKILHPYKK